MTEPKKLSISGLCIRVLLCLILFIFGATLFIRQEKLASQLAAIEQQNARAVNTIQNAPPAPDPIVPVKEQLDYQQRMLNDLDLLSRQIIQLDLPSRLELIQQQMLWTEQNINALWYQDSTFQNYFISQEEYLRTMQQNISDINDMVQRLNDILGSNSEFPSNWTVLGRLNSLESDLDRYQRRQYAWRNYRPRPLPPPPPPPRPPQKPHK